MVNIIQKLNTQFLLEQAQSYYVAGDLQQSRLRFKDVISLEPTNLQALTYLGRIAARNGEVSEACDWLAQAAALPQAGAQIHFELGCFLELQSHSEESIDSALKSYTRAVELDMNHDGAFFNKGNLHKRLGQREEALKSYNAAIFVQPYDPYYLNNRGDLLLNIKSVSFALQDFEQAIELDPSIAYFYDNRGNAFKELNRNDEAALSFKRSLVIEPENALTYNNFGSLFLERDIWDKALACFEMALLIDPGFFHALYNKGLLFQRFNLLEKATKTYEKALLIHPKSFDVAWNLTIIQLLKGDLSKGLLGYENRIYLTENRQYLPTSSKPQLLRGMRSEQILIWNEHGIGNEIFFASFLRHPMLASKKIIAKFDIRLRPLLEASFKDLQNIRFISEWNEVSEAEYDGHLGMASLPYYLEIDKPDAKYWDVPYLNPPGAERISELRKILESRANKGVTSSGTKKIIVGISWKSTNKKTGARRSIALKELQGVFKDLPVQLVNLQYGDVEEEINQTNDALTDILNVSEIDNFSDITGLSQLMSACDLVISVDNSTLHLSSALGRPTCALISFVPDWRWFLESNESPWYKNTKLYRQTRAADWKRPIELLRNDLERVMDTL